MIEASNIFEGLYSELWKEIVPDGLTEAELEFIIKIGHLQPGDKVLDIMCGYGRHAIGLATKKINVTAIDSLEKYVSVIKASYEGSNLISKAIDLREFQTPEKFDVVICMGNSFASFNKKDASTIMTSIARWLKPGGIFILNTWMISEIISKKFKEREWFQIGAFRYLLYNKYLFFPSRIETTHTILTDQDEIESKNDIDFVFSISEMTEIIESAGFSLTELFSTPRMKKFRFGDEYLYFVAQKPA